MTPDDSLDEALERLAAGEASADEAARARDALARDPAAATRALAIERTEAALRAQEMAPVPLGLVASVRRRLDAPVGEAAERVRRPAWVAAAAAALLGLGAWSAVRDRGALPVDLGGAAVARTLGGLVGDVLPARPAWSSLAGASPVEGVPGAGAIGLASLVAGIGLACARGLRGEKGSTTPCT